MYGLQTRLLVVFSLVIPLWSCGVGAVAVGGYLAYEYAKAKSSYSINVDLETAYPELANALVLQGLIVTTTEKNAQLIASDKEHQVLLTFKALDTDKTSLKLISESESDQKKKSDMNWFDKQLKLACENLKWRCN